MYLLLQLQGSVRLLFPSEEEIFEIRFDKIKRYGYWNSFQLFYASFKFNCFLVFFTQSKTRFFLKYKRLTSSSAIYR